MSVIVCHAGPLIALAGIGLAEILRDLFGEVLVAEAVQREVEAGGRKGMGVGIFKSAGWLRVEPLRQPPDALLDSLLDCGEAATIALARQESADLVLIDEVKGRRVARNVYGLAVIGTGRLLVEAKQASLLNEIRPPLERIRSNGYWIADNILPGTCGRPGSNVRRGPWKAFCARSGERQLTRAHIVTLARRFELNPAVFLPVES